MMIKMNYYQIRFVNLVTGKFHEMEVNEQELHKAERDHIQVLSLISNRDLYKRLQGRD